MPNKNEVLKEKPSIKPDTWHDIQTLIALYTSVQNDITNYRNWKWKITTYYVLLSTGIIGLLSNETVKNLLDDRLRCCFLIIQLIAIITSWYHLYKAHKYLSWN